jgi:perosamine synthetase
VSILTTSPQTAAAVVGPAPGPMLVPITRPAVDERETNAVAEVMASGMLISGRRVVEFEERVRAVAGTKHAVSVTNCTTALEVALRGMGVGPGHLVLVTPYSWVTTVNVIEIVGAQPVFVDIDPEHFNMSSRALTDVLATLQRSGLSQSVKAILPVHTFGNMAGIDDIVGIAERNGIALLEDAACALGASTSRGRAGSLGVAGCFSFHPRKVVTTGEGGVVTTDDDELADYIRSYRNHGQLNGAFVSFGSNLRLTEMQGAMGVVQMDKLAGLCQDRGRLAAVYDRILPELGMSPQVRNAGAVVQSYVALCGAGRSSVDIVAQLRDRRIEATIGTVAIPKTPYHGKRFAVPNGTLPGLELVESQAVTLPLFPGMTDAQQEQVISALADVLR